MVQLVQTGPKLSFVPEECQNGNFFLRHPVNAHRDGDDDDYSDDEIFPQIGSKSSLDFSNTSGTQSH